MQVPAWSPGYVASFLPACANSKIQKSGEEVIAIPKPSKPVEDPESYRLISLLCVLCKILERLIYNRVEPIVNPLLPKKQAGFRHGKSIVDQVVLLTQNTEDYFEAKKKTGAVFINLTAAYDTIWHRGLTCKLLRLLPDKHMVRMIMELVRNRSFTVTTGDSKPSRLRRLKNGVSQGSVLASLLFNMYIYNLPSITSKTYVFADDLATLRSSGDWKVLKRTLSEDMITLSAYLQTWRLKLSHAKTVMAAFHLHNRAAKRELKVKSNCKILPFCPVSTYLSVKLDRTLTYRHHLETLRKKLSTRDSLLRQLVGSRWSTGAKTLRTAALSLIYLTAEYCAPAGCRSAHTRLINSVLNDALRIVTGCQRPTPTDNLPVLSSIQPAELCRQGATISLANHSSLDHGHILDGQITEPLAARKKRLKSRRPFVPAARKLSHNLSELSIRASQWTNLIWDTKHSKSMSALGVYIPRVSTRPIRMSLIRTTWVKLIRLRAGVGCFGSSMH